MKVTLCTCGHSKKDHQIDIRSHYPTELRTICYECYCTRYAPVDFYSAAKESILQDRLDKLELHVKRLHGFLDYVLGKYKGSKVGADSHLFEKALALKNKGKEI